MNTYAGIEFDEILIQKVSATLDYLEPLIKVSRQKILESLYRAYHNESENRIVSAYKQTWIDEAAAKVWAGRRSIVSA